MNSMKLIACVDRNRGIGRTGNLLFDLPDERRLFQNLTSGGAVIMGRVTWESLPARPLEGRTNIVISRGWPYRTLYSGFIKAGVAAFADSPDEAVELARQYADEHHIWIIGGGQIYRQMLPMCNEAYITHVDADGNADTFLEGWNPGEWDDGTVKARGANWTMKRYRRKNA